jgi:hypothetical protein
VRIPGEVGHRFRNEVGHPGGVASGYAEITADQRALRHPADINRNGRPTSIGTGGRHQSECPADIIGMRIYDKALQMPPDEKGR